MRVVDRLILGTIVIVLLTGQIAAFGTFAEQGIVESETIGLLKPLYTFLGLFVMAWLASPLTDQFIPEVESVGELRATANNWYWVPATVFVGVFIGFGVAAHGVSPPGLGYNWVLMLSLVGLYPATRFLVYTPQLANLAVWFESAFGDTQPASEVT